MSYLSESGPSYKSVSKRSYVAVAAFNANIFSYTVALNSSFQNVGTLAVLSTATAANCPKGRILRENGRKLYPGANPGITAYMVGVYDAESLLSGYIDPNSPLFAVYNTDKPYYVSARRDPVSGGLVDNSAPVYTNGSVEAGTTVTAGTDLIVGGNFIQTRTMPDIADATSITAAQLLNGVITATITSGHSVALPAAADIIALIGSTVGTTVRFIFINTAASAISATLTAGASMTIKGSPTVAIAQNIASSWIVRVTAATTVDIFRIT